MVLIEVVLDLVQVEVMILMVLMMMMAYARDCAV